MAFFGRKKTEEKAEDIKKIKEAVEEPIIEKQEEEIHEEPHFEEPKKPSFAPLFVKIDRYRTVLNILNDLKTTVVMIKSALAIQKKIDDISNENKKTIETGVGKIEKKISLLDAEFMRPKGYEEEYHPPMYESSSLEGVVSNLKQQIDSLKSELKEIA